MKFVCPVCGYVFDEAQEKASLFQPAGDLAVSICKAAKSLFTPQEGEAPAISGEPAQAEELRPLTPGDWRQFFPIWPGGARNSITPKKRPVSRSWRRTLPVWRLKSRTLL